MAGAVRTARHADSSSGGHGNLHETGKDFIADCAKLNKNGGLALDNKGNIELNGVYYIKCADPEDTLTFPKGKTFNFSGNGLIVSKKSIIIQSNITLANPEKDSLGLIARGGNITFEDACNTVEASCFSNVAPIFTGTTNINGNLVCNEFIRSDALEVNIHYDNRITSVTPLASLRKAGKFEPKRYAVEFADNWSNFTYEKNKDE